MPWSKQFTLGVNLAFSSPSKKGLGEINQPANTFAMLCTKPWQKVQQYTLPLSAEDLKYEFGEGGDRWDQCDDQGDHRGDHQGDWGVDQGDDQVDGQWDQALVAGF